MDLHWHQHESGRRHYMLAGCQQQVIVLLTIRGGVWDVDFFIPLETRTFQRSDLDSARDDAERVVQDWFAMCATSRPALDVEAA